MRAAGEVLVTLEGARSSPAKALPYPVRCLPAPQPGLGCALGKAGMGSRPVRLPQAARPGSDPQPEYFARLFAPRLSQSAINK